MQENENFAKQMDNLKEQLKEKIEWNQVDLLVMVCFLYKESLA
jgi:hypothetical protein